MKFVSALRRKSREPLLIAPVAEADLEPRARWIVLRLRNPYQEDRAQMAAPLGPLAFIFRQPKHVVALDLLVALTSRKYMPHG